MKEGRSGKMRDRAGWLLLGWNVALIGIKIRGDARRHSRHEEHSQNCDCFAMCLRCGLAR